MLIKIPYQDNVSLRAVLNWTVSPVDVQNDNNLVCDVERVQDPEVVATFHVLRNLQEISEVFEILPELVFKMKCGTMKNPIIEEVARDIFDDQVLIMVFRVKIYFKRRKITQEPDRAPIVVAEEWGHEFLVLLKLRSTESSTIEGNEEFIRIIENSHSNKLVNQSISGLKQMFERIKRKREGEITIKYYSVLPTKHHSSDPVLMLNLIKNCIEEWTNNKNDLARNSTLDYNGTLREVQQQCRGNDNPQEEEHTTGQIYRLQVIVQTQLQEQLVDIDGPEWYELRLRFDGNHAPVHPEGGERQNELCLKLEALLLNISQAEREIDKILDKRTHSESKRLTDLMAERTEVIEEAMMYVQRFIRRMDIGSILDQRLVEFSKRNFVHECLKLPKANGKQTTLVTMGKTGQGKSAVSNSICLENFFTEKEGVGSDESPPRWNERIIDSRFISVLDTPGVLITSSKTEAEVKKQGKRLISDILAQNPDGYNAFLLVIKYDHRLTLHDIQVLKKFENYFNDFFKHVIFVVTVGDKFLEKQNQNFHVWCRNTGLETLDELFKKSEYKCLLFNNKGGLDEKRRQLLRLLCMVDGIGSLYKNDHFEEVKKKRNKLCNDCMDSQYDFICYAVQKVKMRSKLEDDDKKRLGNLKLKNAELKDCIEQIEKENERMKEEKADSYGFRGVALKGITNELMKCKSEYYFLYFFQKTSNKTLRTSLTEYTNAKVDEWSCFPACSLVIAKDGSRISMEELDIGDQILSRDCHGRLFYDTVYMFGHGDNETFAIFIVLETLKQQVNVTENHLVFCVKEGIERCVPAKDVVIGDKLIVAVSDQTVEYLTVQRISKERKRGLFAPFTMSGTIVVDGALMSCYIDIVAHNTAHFALWPLREVFNVSPKTVALVNGARKNTTVPLWAKVAYEMLSFFQQFSKKWFYF